MSRTILTEVYDFFCSRAADNFFRRTFPAILDLHDYDKSKCHDKKLKARILSECTHYLPIPGFTSLSQLLVYDKETAVFLRDQLILRSKWWFHNYVPYDEYYKRR